MFPARQTIVIVEDDACVGNVLMRGLALRGYHTELFESPVECLNAVVTRVAACFVIDVHLGRECGIDLSKKLIALGVKAPVIHMSGAATDTIRRRAMESGGVAFLDKPFGIVELVGIIEGVTGRSAT
jgi:FixJ family two-component response regulator